MRLRVDENTNTVHLRVEELASFARQKHTGNAGFRMSAGDDGSQDSTMEIWHDVPVSAEREGDGFTVVIDGEADAVSFDGRTLCCEMRRRIRRNPEYVTVGEDASYLARAMATAYMLAQSVECESIALRLAFIREGSGEVRCFESMYSRAVLERAFDALYSRALPFIRTECVRRTEGLSDLAKMRFPYASVREGQRDCMEELYRCIRSGRRLLVSAPTGIGKTMSGIYPALRALGKGHADRVFYFTAKTVTGNAALDAVRLLGEQAPRLRCIRITAKERLCPRRRGGENAYGMCRSCANKGMQGMSTYEERRDAAMLRVLESGNVYDSADLAKIAADYGICPYELSLDVSEYCEIIVCDYGYLLDPAVRFRRYFEQDRGERYVFLFDEAHNLPDRAREMYSAALERRTVEAFCDAACGALPDDVPLREAADGIRAMFDTLDALCAENAEVPAEEDGSIAGFFLQTEIPAFVTEAAARLRAVCDAYLRRDHENAAPLFEDMRVSLRRFGEAVRRADDSFAFYAQSGGGESGCRIMCLDPGALLDASLQKAVSTALFSATLSPMDYYADVCGCHDAVRLDLPSPYERENLCLVTVDSVSTRFSQRKNSSSDVAELIETVTAAREGNYIVYFPSYAYMESVCRQYLRLSPSMPVIMQKRGMSIGERQRFLRAFEKGEESGEGVVAFRVLGGIFSEGIDLRGEKLIGSIIVGIGLPGLSSELNILSEYYEKTRESGRDYAYLYPAVNKILQAAGRVIRSEEDRGVVVLIDDRYADPGVRKLFPAHWSRMQYTGDAYTLGVILERFWEEQNEKEYR